MFATEMIERLEDIVASCGDLPVVLSPREEVSTVEALTSDGDHAPMTSHGGAAVISIE